MIQYYIIPGLGNSGAGHWQTILENSSDAYARILQEEWDAPEKNDWIATIDKTLENVDTAQIVLIGHSLGCAAIVHWAQHYERPLKGALLVAPSDPEAPQYTFPAKGFDPLPTDPLPFKSIVVASENDPWVSIDRACYFADSWGSQFINIGEAGHINVPAGYGKWDEVEGYLKYFDGVEDSTSY